LAQAAGQHLGLSYANADRRNVSARFGLLQTGGDCFVFLPLERKP